MARAALLPPGLCGALLRRAAAVAPVASAAAVPCLAHAGLTATATGASTELQSWQEQQQPHEHEQCPQQQPLHRPCAVASTLGAELGRAIARQSFLLHDSQLSLPIGSAANRERLHRESFCESLAECSGRDHASPSRRTHWQTEKIRGGEYVVRGLVLGVGGVNSRGAATAAGVGGGGGVAAAADAELVKALKAELEYEDETYDTPEVVVNPPASVSEWAVDNPAGSSELVLRRNFEGEDIAVLLSSADADFPPQEDDEQEESDEEGEDETQILMPIPAKVVISKPQQGAGVLPMVLELECVVDSGGEWIIEDVAMPSDDVPEDSALYTGPRFQTLEPALQEQFVLFLERRGFNAELGQYVRSLLDHKEQQEYTGWLRRVSSFLEKPPSS